MRTILQTSCERSNSRWRWHCWRPARPTWRWYAPGSDFQRLTPARDNPPRSCRNRGDARTGAISGQGQGTDMIEALQGAGQRRCGAGPARPVSDHDLPSASRARPAWLISIFEGRIVSVTQGPFVMPSSAFALRACRREWAKVLEQPAAAGLERPDGADQAAGAEGRRRSPGLHGQSALLQGGARQAARTRERAA